MQNKQSVKADPVSFNGSSGIEWCGETWEVTAGCTKVSSGCAHCYAETLVGGRFAGSARRRVRDGVANGSPIDLSLEVINDRGRWNGEVRELGMNLNQPLARKSPTVYFVNSRSDLFHEGVDFEYIDQVFAVMALCPEHRFLILTKRPGRMREYLTETGSVGHRIYRQVERWLDQGGCGNGFFGSSQWDRAHALAGESTSGSGRIDHTAWKMPLPNVWLGTSVEDQETVRARVDDLLACPVARAAGQGGGRFLSAEPLLGPLDLGNCLCTTYSEGGLTLGQYIDWVIVGGESGADARACSVRWIESIVDQCRDTSVPVFVKQLGKFCFGQWDHEDNDGHGCTLRMKDPKGGDPSAWPDHLRVREVPAGLVLGGGS